MVEQDDPTAIPVGVSPGLRNVRFHLTSCRTRDGIQSQYGFILPDGGAVTGLAGLKIGGPAGDLQVPLAFSALGTLYIESPAGSGKVLPITGPLVQPPIGASMQVAAAFGKGFLAFSDLKQSKGAPAVYNPTLGTLDPLSMKLVGQTWAPATAYVLNEVITPATPIGGNGHSYQCIQAGTSAANQPNFPLTEAGQVVDGTVIWKELTPLIAQALPEPAIPVVVRTPGAGGFAANRDVYLIVTLANGVGETDAQLALAFKFVNTANNDRFTVAAPVLPLWVQGLLGTFKVTGYNVYEADVATGGGAPALATYKKVNGGQVGIGAGFNVDNTGAGAAPPLANTALVVPAGNICFGLRYLVVLFVNRNGYISGMTSASVVSANFGANGLQVYVAHIPLGPVGTVARICAITPAGQLSQLAGTGISNAGPYFFIEPAPQYFVRLGGGFNLANVPGGVTVADVVNGVQETSTLINDNVTTAATFNFDDNYLKSTLNDVSAYFRKMQVPASSDLYYSKTLKRMFYADDSLPSGWRVSLPADPESVYSDTGLVQVAENNGENRTAVREWDSNVYLMKENSGHLLNPDANDPSQWKPTEQWTGSGPCGPRAVDVSTTFMAYACRKGFWIFKGGKPFSISKELPAYTGLTWKNINWAFQHLIWVMIDDETKEIRIGVPYGQSTVPNITLKLNYEESPDFNPPIHFSPYVGKEIASGACYKWSIDDIAANLAIRAERRIPNPPAFLDAATRQSQVLYASANADGAVSAVTPLIFDDNGVGIDSWVETATPVVINGDGKVVRSLFGPNQLGGVQLNIGGYGQGSVEVLALRAVDPKQGGAPIPGGKPAANAGFVRKLKKPWIANVPYSCGASGQNERFRLRISNDKRAGTWFDLKWACIFARPVSSARPR